MFPEKFYMDCFKKGIYGIIIMSCGVECAYEGAYPALAARIEKLYPMMKEAGLDTRRIRLTGVCTVCTRAFVKEVNEMNRLVEELGPPARRRPRNSIPAPAHRAGSGTKTWKSLREGCYRYNPGEECGCKR
jgi:coenzyme F420-reducing hydrogenase delta subunit